MKRQLERAILGGVCTGLESYTGVAALWFRLAFVCAFLWFGAGIIVYLVLWALLVAEEASNDTDD